MSGFYVDRNIVIILSFALTSSFGIEKHWLPDLEWQNASNWVNNRVPGIDDHVIFPLETRHAVGIAKTADLKLSQIDLPRYGSLVLFRDGKLELSRSSDSKAKVSTWQKEGHFFWADPENWNGTSNAAPHLERVPCRRDDVVLPKTERTLSVLLPIKEIQVRSIRMSNQQHPFTTWQWADYQNRREFSRGRSTVKYSEYSCEKCSCQNDFNGDYLEEVCAIQRPRCGFTFCEYPLKVEGHCCGYCGGRLSLSNKASLSLVGTATSDALEGYEKRIGWHVRRTFDGAVEVLVQEKGEYSSIDVQEAVENIKATLLNAGIEVLSTETAGAAMQDNRLAVALGPLLASPLIILGLFLLGFLYFGYSLRQILSGCAEAFSSIQEGIRVDKPESENSFGFARFENVPEGNVQIADVSSTSESKPKNQQESGKSSLSGGRFENPLYRSKKRREGERKMLDIDAPLSLATLKDKVEDHLEEVEMDIDQ